MSFGIGWLETECGFSVAHHEELLGPGGEGLGCRLIEVFLAEPFDVVSFGGVAEWVAASDAWVDFDDLGLVCGFVVEGLYVDDPFCFGKGACEVLAELDEGGDAAGAGLYDFARFDCDSLVGDGADDSAVLVEVDVCGEFDAFRFFL